MVDILDGKNRANNMTQGPHRTPPASPHSNVLYLKSPQKPKQSPSRPDEYTQPPTDSEKTLVNVAVRRRRSMLAANKAAEMTRETSTESPNVHVLPWEIETPDFVSITRYHLISSGGDSDISARAAVKYRELLAHSLALFHNYKIDTYWLIASPHFYLVDPTSSNVESVHRWEKGLVRLPQDLDAMDLVDESSNNIFSKMVRERITNVTHAITLPYADIAEVAIDIATLGSHLFEAVPFECVDDHIDKHAAAFLKAAGEFTDHVQSEEDKRSLSNAIRRVTPYLSGTGISHSEHGHRIQKTSARIVPLKPVHT